MRTATLQIPLQQDLRDDAVIVARDYGFSSLQEIVRVFLTKLAKRRVAIRLEEEPFAFPGETSLVTGRWSGILPINLLPRS